MTIALTSCHRPWHRFGTPVLAAGFEQAIPTPRTGTTPGRQRRRRPPRKPHTVRNVVLGVVGGVVGLFIVLAAIGAAVGGGAKSNNSAGGGSTTAPVVSATTSSPPPAPAPTASPNGTYQGSCSYDLGSDPVNGTAVATGDVQVTNTGNIGTVDRISITWPQEGYSPLGMSKRIHLAVGANRDIQFHRPLSSDEVDKLQNYQLNHSDDGCTYNVTETSTFGAVQGG